MLLHTRSGVTALWSGPGPHNPAGIPADSSPSPFLIDSGELCRNNTLNKKPEAGKFHQGKPNSPNSNRLTCVPQDSHLTDAHSKARSPGYFQGSDSIWMGLGRRHARNGKNIHNSAFPQAGISTHSCCSRTLTRTLC